MRPLPVSWQGAAHWHSHTQGHALAGTKSMNHWHHMAVLSNQCGYHQTWATCSRKLSNGIIDIVNDNRFLVIVPLKQVKELLI